MAELIRECCGKVGPEEELEVALEATGGMELNWLKLFRRLDEAGEVDMNVYRFNPLVIRRFTEQQLRSNKTDEISAQVLADYLRLGLAEKKARGIVEAARTSVASQTDEDTALTLSLTAEDLLRLEKRIDRLKERLWNRVRDRRAPRLLASIEGIGKWSAAVLYCEILYCEIGDITRFSSAKTLIAYAGLDPQREESGDIAREKTISKQGNAHIRSVLYGCVTAAIRNGSNPPVRNLYDRLKERGKHQKVAEVACMLWARGDRLWLLEQQRAVRSGLREASEGAAGREEIHHRLFP